MERENAWKTYGKKEIEELEKLNRDYIEFLSTGKTERECVKEIIRQAEEAGYRNIDEVIKEGKKTEYMDKIYADCMKNTDALFNIGRENI